MKCQFCGRSGQPSGFRRAIDTGEVFCRNGMACINRWVRWVEKHGPPEGGSEVYYGCLTCNHHGPEARACIAAGHRVQERREALNG